MSNTLIATLGGIAALIGWGVSDWLTAKSSRKHDGFETNVAVQVSETILLAPVILLTISRWPSLTHDVIIAAGAVCFTFAFAFFIKAFSIGAVGVVAPIGNAFPFFTLLLTLIFLSTSYTKLQILAMIIIVFGAVLLGVEKSKKRYGLHSAEILYAISAAIFWGVGFFAINSVVNKETWQGVEGIISIVMLFTASLLLIGKNGSKCIDSFKKIKTNKTGLLAGITLGVGSIPFFASGSKTGGILIPAAIASAGPLVTSLLAALIDKEKINLTKRAGAVIVVAGIVLLNV